MGLTGGDHTNFDAAILDKGYQEAEFNSRAIDGSHLGEERGFGVPACTLEVTHILNSITRSYVLTKHQGLEPLLNDIANGVFGEPPPHIPALPSEDITEDLLDQLVAIL